ncbi:GDSL-type esterase/lipase family protein [Bryobacter aggregatus]|uniref:GDSL-type esterase/lipase family protein n=1 Tax=Bryobacter aggregatus TaxID=360054 RepID=UPI001EE2CA96|nr:GDSL-type esterase/lipase family protein [Bryobacter aggregatus]
MLSLAASVAALEYIPQLKNYRLMDWDAVQQVVDFKPSIVTKSDPIVEAEVRLKPGRALEKTGARAAVEPLSDPKGSLHAFYEAIERVEAGEPGAVVRLAHYGDSPTTADLITADVRALLQKRFGDAGHGFYLIAKPWAWYGHRGVDSDSSGWDTEASNLTRVRDGYYGYGGVSFKGAAGARARFRLKEPGYVRVEVAYWQQLNGGSFTVEACGDRLGEQATAGEPSEGFTAYTLPADCKDIAVSVQSGPVRLFGVQFLRGSNGVVYDSLGLNGAYISVLAKFLREDHWAKELQHYAPDVVVINYGTNESVYAAFVDKVFEKELRESIRRIRAALPDKSILVMSPMDRGERNAAGQIETVPALQRLVELERKVAADEGVAFFNTFEAMGGNGTMAKWYAAEPRLVGADFIHPMPGGAKIIGNLLYQAMVDGYNRYKTAKTTAQFAKTGL